jgi:invasion protein IalB
LRTLKRSDNLQLTGKIAISMKRFLTLLVVAGSLIATPVLAQPATEETKPAGAPPVTTKAFDDWLVRCPMSPQPMPCDAVQLLLEPKSKQRVLSVSVAYDQVKAAQVVRIILPLGVWLPNGVTVQAGGVKIDKVVVRRCEPFGCVVEGFLDAKLRDAMRKGGDAKIVVYDQNQKPLDLKFSLKGFAAAEDHMTAETKKVKLPTAPAPAATPAPAAPATPTPATPAPAKPATPTP